MPSKLRPHVLGIDDGAFTKGQRDPVPIVGVMMEGADLVEAIAVTEFPVDGAGATDFLADWVSNLRLHPTLQGIVLGGITIAGLGVVDLPALATAVSTPVIAVTRRPTTDHRVREALDAAGLTDRIETVERAEPAFRAEPGLYISHAGGERDAALQLVRATRRKSKLPEPLRIAHLVAAAIARGESRGRA